MRQRLIRPASVWTCTALALLLAGCTHAASGSSGVTPALPDSVQESVPAAAPLAPIVTSPGAVFGLADRFKPVRGDYPTGGKGQTIHGVPCLPTMPSNDYHVHFYLGIVYEGQQIALPQGIGMEHSGAAVNGFVDTAQCFYYLHTHDSSGIVHVESPRQLPYGDSIYTLNRFFQIWGVPLGPEQLGPLKGPMHVFVGNVPLKQVTVSAYHAYKGDITKIKIWSHEVVWLEIGTTYFHAKQLPPVTFYAEY